MLIRYNDRQYSQFVNIKIGDCFSYQGNLFIKIGDAKTIKNEVFNAINLLDGTKKHIPLDGHVELANAEIVVK